jgi:hypothetical protein
VWMDVGNDADDADADSASARSAPRKRMRGVFYIEPTTVFFPFFSFPRWYRQTRSLTMYERGSQVWKKENPFGLSSDRRCLEEGERRRLDD